MCKKFKQQKKSINTHQKHKKIKCIALKKTVFTIEKILQIIKKMKTITTIEKLHQWLQKHSIQKTMNNEQNEILKNEFDNSDSNCILIATCK